MVTAGAAVDVQRHVACPHGHESRVPSTLSRYGVTICGNVTSVYPPLEVNVARIYC